MASTPAPTPQAKRKYEGNADFHRDAPARGAPSMPTISMSRVAILKWSPAHKHTLATITENMTRAFSQVVPNDTIQICGLSPLRNLKRKPSDVLRLAQEKLYARRFDEIPTEWRRLYEEACIQLAVKKLSSIFTPSAAECSNDVDHEHNFAGAIEYLDKALFVAGAPGRKTLIYETFDQLEAFLDEAEDCFPGMAVNDKIPPAGKIDRPIPRSDSHVSLEAFQSHLDASNGPIIIQHTMEPAKSRWHDAGYLLRRTLGGRRTVPVEIGESYTDDSWTQKAMPFAEFMQRFLAPQKPEAIGYLAQHDLLSQIPALRSDVQIPDYCYATPPPPKGAAAETFGLEHTPLLDEPLLHAWLGPKGTKTPLHTDAYHNVLCQVVGYKYVRLYAPEEKSKLYPQGVNEQGIRMDNTTKIPVKYMAPKEDEASMDAKDAIELHERFPLFKTASYQEAILGPDECLYIPLGWWHYVESMTNSFSVSFWFN